MACASCSQKYKSLRNRATQVTTTEAINTTPKKVVTSNRGIIRKSVNIPTPPPPVPVDSES